VFTLDDPEETAETKKKQSFLDRIEHNWIEIAAAALMALATIMSAFCAYQSSRWNGLSTDHYSKSDQAFITSTQLTDKVNQELSIDVSMLANYINVSSEGKTDLANL